MESIPHPDFLINAADPQALTRLLDLPEVEVIAIEQATWLARRYIQCRVVTDGANCSRCLTSRGHDTGKDQFPCATPL